jgi:hypothetical protein
MNLAPINIPTIRDAIQWYLKKYSDNKEALSSGLVIEINQILTLCEASEQSSTQGVVYVGIDLARIVVKYNLRD